MMKWLLRIAPLTCLILAASFNLASGGFESHATVNPPSFPLNVIPSPAILILVLVKLARRPTTSLVNS